MSRINKKKLRKNIPARIKKIKTYKINVQVADYKYLSINI